MNVNLDNYSANLARFVGHASQYATADGGGDATIVRAESVQVGTAGPRDANGFQTLIWTRDLRLADTDGDRAGGFSALFRSRANKEANDATRELFKSAVAEMFGGEDNIPENVRAAMKMKDYGKGRPLTARRIMAVKTAIDAAIGDVDYGQFVPAILKQAKAYRLPVPSGEQFHDLVRTAADYQAATGCTVETAATSLFTIPQKMVSMLTNKILDSTQFQMFVRSFGYDADQCENLAKAAAFYQRAMRCSIDRAIKSACSPTGVANRLMNYGGRFMATADNFRQGVRLLGKFEAWFNEISATTNNRSLPKKTVSQINGGFGAFLNQKCIGGFERFVFEDLASNPAFDLTEQDAEKVFGFENNDVTRFIGRGFYEASTATLLQVPVEQRRVVFRAAAALCPLATNQSQQLAGPTHKTIFVGRMLKHLDELTALANRNELTAENVIRTCYPDIVNPRAFTIKVVDDFITETLARENANDPEGFATRYFMMANSGETIDHVIAAYQNHEQLPNVPYLSAYSVGLDAFNGSTEEARKQLMQDLPRFTNYAEEHAGGDAVQLERVRGFNFPEGTPRIQFQGGSVTEAACRALIDTVEAFCGKGNVRQASAVLFCLSQSGLENLKGGLHAYGIYSNEHSPCEYTLSKDAETGTVKIVYSNPNPFPIAFNWEVTVDRNGVVTTTPMTVVDERGHA